MLIQLLCLCWAVSEMDMEVEGVLEEAHEVEDKVGVEVEEHNRVTEVLKHLPVVRFPAKSVVLFRARNARMCRGSNAIMCQGSSAEMFPDKFPDRCATRLLLLPHLLTLTPPPPSLPLV